MITSPSAISRSKTARAVSLPGGRAVLPGNWSIVPGSGSTSPLWFNGRFLAADDLKREQRYFLDRQAKLGRAAGFGVLHGLFVEQGVSAGEPAPETIIVRAGDGITPSGELVMISEDLTIRLSDLADEENLDVQFGLSETPQPPARTRTGIYVLALRPLEFTANPIASYPANLQAARITQDGDILEATAVSLVPYPNPVNSFDSSLQQAALARQIFGSSGEGVSSDSLLPLAMISIDRDVIQWIDPYLVRRDGGPQDDATRVGLAQPATQQAFFMQYDSRLQAIMAPFLGAKKKASFAATDYFQELPPAGRFPVDAIDAVKLTQIFFPQQMVVDLTLVPADELSALLTESMSLPPIDLTLPPVAYANMSIFALAPVPRSQFATLKNTLPVTRLAPALPQTGGGPIVRLHPIPVRGQGIAPPPPPASWADVLKSLEYGFYVLRRGEPVFPSFAMPATTTTPSPTSTTHSPLRFSVARTQPAIGTTPALRTTALAATPALRTTAPAATPTLRTTAPAATPTLRTTPPVTTTPRPSARPSRRARARKK